MRIIRLRMGTVAQSSSLKERVAGKWQLPLFFLGLLMLGGSLYISLPNPTCIPLSQAIEQLDVLVSGGAVMGPDRLDEAS